MTALLQEIVAIYPAINDIDNFTALRVTPYTSVEPTARHIMNYFHHPCPVPQYFLCSLVSIYWTFRFIRQCPA